MIRPAVEVLIDRRYPDYAVLEIGAAYVPVQVRNGLVVDAFTPAANAVTAFTNDDEAWEFIADDARAMGRI